MGIFDFFRKKPSEMEYDVSNMQLTDLKTGFVFEYDMQSWVVKESYRYRWQNNSESFEFLIDNGKTQWFMGIEGAGQLSIVLMQKCKIREVLENLPEYIEEHETPPREITYQNIKYFLDEEAVGVYQSEHDKDWSDLVSWDYYTKTEDKILSIEQWGEHEFEVWAGIVVNESEFSNIIPGGH